MQAFSTRPHQVGECLVAIVRNIILAIYPAVPGEKAARTGAGGERSHMDERSVLIEGTCDRAFAAVRDAFERNFRIRSEIGAAVCVYQDGEKVVDLWGGHKDLARTDPWRPDTIVIMNSVAKSISALCTHILIDRSAIDFDAPIASYWPEFAAAGKQGVLIRHVLSHTDGVIFCDHAPPGSWFDWDVHIRAIERQEPAWEPGTKGAYNSINIGFILGEIVRRVTGKPSAPFCVRPSRKSSQRITTSACVPTSLRAYPTCTRIQTTRFSSWRLIPRRRSAAPSARHRHSAISRIAAKFVSAKSPRLAAMAMPARLQKSTRRSRAMAASMVCASSVHRPCSAPRSLSGTTIA